MGMPECPFGATATRGRAAGLGVGWRLIGGMLRVKKGQGGDDCGEECEGLEDHVFEVWDGVVAAAGGGG